MTTWRTVLPEEERAIYEQSGYGTAHSFQGRSARSALLVIDCTLKNTGTKPQSMADAIKEYATSCGPAAWEALPKIKEMLDLFRDAKRPIIFSRGDAKSKATAKAATKATKRRDIPDAGYDFPSIIEPQAGEWVMGKVRASAFFGTPLTSYLVQQKVDTLVVCGTTTSGCVRASVIDAFSSGFDVFVIDEGCFDRAPTPHKVNLWDMNAKYATVLTLEELKNAFN